MTWLWSVLALVVAQRLGELWLAGRNTRRLKAEGAIEIGAGHYWMFVVLHASWLVAIALLTPGDTRPNLWLLGVYLLLQFARVWVIASLGRFWTTRIISLPSAPLSRRGPYRWVRHPNYWIASAEIAVLPLAFGQVWIAVIWSLANAALVAYRIRVEEAALADRPG